MASCVVKFRTEAVYKISSASGRWLLALADQIEKAGGKFMLQVPNGTLAAGSAGRYGWDLASRPDDMDKARKVLIRKAIACGAVVGETPTEIEKDPELIVAISDLIMDVLMQFTSVMREATGDMAYFTPHWLLAEGAYKGDDVNPYAGLIVWRHIQDTYASVSVINEDTASQKLSQAMMVMVDQALNLTAYLGAVNDCINEYMKSGGKIEVVDDKVGIILEKFVVRESMSGLPDAEEWKAIGAAAEAKKKSREQGNNVTWNDVYMDLMRVCDQQLSGARMYARKIRETGPGAPKFPDGISFAAIDENQIEAGKFDDIGLDLSLAAVAAQMPATMDDYRKLIDHNVPLPSTRMQQKLRDHFAQKKSAGGSRAGAGGKAPTGGSGKENRKRPHKDKWKCTACGAETFFYATRDEYNWDKATRCHKRNCGHPKGAKAPASDAKDTSGAPQVAAAAMASKPENETSAIRAELDQLKTEMAQRRAPDFAGSAISSGDDFGLAGQVSFAAIGGQMMGH